MGKYFWNLLMGCVLAVLISGCGSTTGLSPKDTITKDGYQEGPDFVAPGTVGGAGGAQVVNGDAATMQTTGGMPAERDEAFLKGLQGDVYDLVKGKEAQVTVYFEFDQSAIRPSDREKLRQFAESSHGDGRFIVVGRCDWFGTREYNLGLGERRANAVMNYLKMIGFINPIEVLSRSNLDSLQGLSREDAWRDRNGGVYKLPGSSSNASASTSATALENTTDVAQ
jgi:peptidoglycan-associated lipoprotein